MSTDTEHLYQSWVVTRKGSYPVNFTSQTKALDYWSKSEGEALMEQKLQRIACGMPTRGFCGHCDNGIPLVPTL